MQLVEVGADIRAHADPTFILDAARASFSKRSREVPAYLRRNASPIGLVLLGGAVGATLIGLAARPRKSTGECRALRAVSRRRQDATKKSPPGSGAVVDGQRRAGICWRTVRSEHADRTEASRRTKGGVKREAGRIPKSTHACNADGRCEAIWGLTDFGGYVGRTRGGGRNARSSEARGSQASMKRADVVRLALAYVLIASSGRENKAPPDVLTAATPAAGAASPIQVAARGWIDIARSVWKKIGENRVIAVAAGLTFYGLLAIFPTITALVSVYGLFADPTSINRQLQSLAGIVPEGAITIIGDQVQRISSQGAGTLGLAFVSGLAVALWSANSGVKALFDALNVAYEAEETRGFFRLNAVSLLFTVSGVLLAVLGLSLTVIVPWVLDHFFFGMAFVGLIIRWLSIPLGIVVALFMLAVLYRFGPAVRKPAWRWVTPGSLFAVLFLIIASGAFAFYAAHFGSYNKTYGSLGAAIGFMTWLWISFIVVMVGAEINSEVEREAKGAAPAAARTSPRTS